MPQAQTIDISANWQWKQRDPAVDDILSQARTDKDWTDCVSFPSDIHVELIKAGQIPDPYVGFNEHKVQWVGEREWLYRTIFDCEAPALRREITFEGLDTFCTVYLNGQEILKAENQFTSYTVPVKSIIQPVKNELVLHFQSAKLIALELEKKFGRVRAGSSNLGHPSRVYVRKAQYDWRWDWGPELMTAGPYRPIKLTSYTTELSIVYPRASVSIPSDTAALAVDITLHGAIDKPLIVAVSLTKKGETTATKEAVATLQGGGETEVKGVVEWEFAKGEVDLWWPVGYGEAALYDVVVTLKNEDDQVLDTKTNTIGFRHVELVQEPFNPEDGDHSVTDVFGKGQGTSFFFRINGVGIFCGGSNWVPADSFLTTVTPERFRAWLQLLKDGNQNMVRVWGGGVYEPDCFYEICDELGLLVWQDFQFACGVYPAHHSFVTSVKKEAVTNVIRLRHHPSIVIWCGNNEDYQQVLQWGGVDTLPARLLYEKVFPDVIAKYTNPPVPYHRGSPYGGKGWDTSDPTVGDVHQWNVWATSVYYQNYDELGGRFISEFGLPAMPDMRTIEYWLEDGTTSEAQKEKLRYAQSKSMQQHNKAGLHERRFAAYMNDNFRLTTDLESHVYHTQLMQSEGVGYAYRVWRREWRGKGKEYTAGAIVWQLNDCWPVTSWAIADYFVRPKPVYWTIARELRPYTVGIQRKVHLNRESDRPKQFYEYGAFQSMSATIDVWATNSTLTSKDVVLELTYFDLESDWTYTHREEPITLAPNQSTEIVVQTEVPGPPHPDVDKNAIKDTDPLPTTTGTVVISARLLDATQPDGSSVIARYADWPQPYRLLDLPDPGLQVTVSGEELRVIVTKPVKGLVFGIVAETESGQREEVKWSDNTLDVVPGDEQVILATGLAGRKVTAQYLGKEKSFVVS